MAPAGPSTEVVRSQLIINFRMGDWTSMTMMVVVMMMVMPSYSL